MAYTQNWGREFQKNTAFLDRNSLMNVIEIGSFEGATSNYIVDNLLAHNYGQLVCVDPLDSNYDLDDDQVLFDGQYDRFIENTDHNKGQIKLMRERSIDALRFMEDDFFDFIYIDGDHTYDSVYADGVNAFRVCKVGGYILFDDYTWGSKEGMKKAIDTFLSENKNHKLLLKLNQVLIQKLPYGCETEDGQEWYNGKSAEILFAWNKIHAVYTNLDFREDRDEHMIAELKRIGLTDFIQRQRSFHWKELYYYFDKEQRQKVDVMYKRTPGAIGCHYSQVAIMEEALRQGKHAMVCEDDLLFCDDFPERLKIIYNFLNQHEWDIFWMGGTYHIEPNWHGSIDGQHTNPDLQICKCDLNRDWEETSNPHIVRTYGAFSTHCYLVNKDRIEHILDLLDTNVYRSMGIDWVMILHQPNLNCFAFNPGCVIQYDGESNIGGGFSAFSGFARLGSHWFAKTINK